MPPIATTTDTRAAPATTPSDTPARDRFTTLIALLLAVFILAPLAACSRAKPAAVARGAVVLVIGDSITAAYGLSPEQSWTTTLATQTGWKVINAGVSGDTTTGGRSRLPALLDEHRPALVIVELGGNDMLRRLAVADTVANLEAMIADVRKSGALPVLMATPQPSVAGAVLSSLSDAPFYADIGKRLRVPLIDDVLSETLSKQSYKGDPLHPNAEGQRAIGEATVKALRRLEIAP